MEGLNNKSKGLAILFVGFITILLLFCGYIVFIKKDTKSPDVPVVDPGKNNENDEYDYTLSEYGIISYGEVNPFKNLDFSKKEFGLKVTIETNAIKYVDEDYGFNKSIDAPGVVQAGITCDCGSCHNIYYLNNNGELYSIQLDHGELTDNYEKELLYKNVESFVLYEVGVVESTTCGGYDLIVKYKDGSIKIEGYDLKLLERYWLNDAGYDHELFVVSKNAKVKNYLKDNNNNNLVAKQVFIIESENKYGIYVIDQNDNLYYADDYTKAVLNKHSDKKVKSYIESDGKIIITYEDLTTESIDALLSYDYSKEFIVK